MITRQIITSKTRDGVLAESRHACAICGSTSYLELAHIRPIALGGDSTADNLIVLCPTCHRSVDITTRISGEALAEIKAHWVKHGRPGRELVLRDFASASTASSGPDVGASVMQHELAHWLIALREYETFDSVTTRIMSELAALPSEDDFINLYLRPLLEWLGFQGITVMHHTGRPEHGKDIVFRDDDRLGGLSFYAVVATRAKIHATSTRTPSSGHYSKILDQVAKCYMLRHHDMNLKSAFFIDKVVVASADTITEEALLFFREWEERERRHLIYWSGPTIAGMILKMKVGSAQHRHPADRAARDR